MKKSNLFAMALAALAIVSCSKENVGGNNEQPPVVEGVETYATFSFNMDGSGVKANAASGTDDGKTEEEAENVKDIRIVIFKSGTPSTLEANNVTELKDGVTAAAPVKITSGQKRIFVFANTKNNTYLNGLKEGSNLNDCYASLMATPTPFTLDSLADATTGYFMSNARTQSSSKLLLPNISAEDSKTLGDANNHFSFTVQRAISKVTAKLANEQVINIVDPLNPAVTVATLKNLKYTVRNINKSIRPVQLFAETDITDADAIVKTTLPLAPFFNNYDGKSDAFMKDTANFSDYDRSFDCDQLLSHNEAAAAVLVTENSNARQVLGNTTYLAVQAKYEPKVVVGACEYKPELNEGTFTPTAGTLGEDFYVVNLVGLHTIGKPGEGLKNNIFDTEEHAKTLLTAVLATNGIKPDAEVAANQKVYDDAIAARLRKYTGGLAYYRLNIGVTTTDGKTTFGIKRNSIYKVVISKINKLGSTSVGDLDKIPDTPVTSLETYISATIKVADWETMDQSGEL